MLMQSLWKESKGWDEMLSPELQQKFREVTQDMIRVKEFKVQRKLTTGSQGQCELRCFCDASASGYGACVYILVLHPGFEKNPDPDPD